MNNRPPPAGRWLNRTVLGLGLASLLSDWSPEIATTVMPAFLATLGVAAGWLGLIKGVSDALSARRRLALDSRRPAPAWRHQGPTVGAR
jgi:hypothetical protein